MKKKSLPHLEVEDDNGITLEDLRNSEDGSAETRLQRQKLLLKQQILKLLTLMFAFLSVIFLPLMTLLLVIFIEWLVTPIPVVTVNPIGVQVVGDGIRITTLAKSIIIIGMLKDTAYLYIRGTPEIEIVVTEPQNND